MKGILWRCCVALLECSTSEWRYVLFRHDIVFSQHERIGFATDTSLSERGKPLS